jgi:hypothetical protein
MIDHLIFDTTDAQTMADTHSVGAYLRDAAGSLITSQVNGSQQALDVGINVAGVQIDPRQIRALDYTTDNMAIKGATGNQLVINADGSINANVDVSVTNGSDKAEDAAHVSGDIGTYMLAVRQDTLANSVSADGDYASLKVNANGALYVDVASFSGTVTVTDAALANTAIISKANVLDTADTAEAAVASALASRKYLWLYNNDNTKVFIGGSGVTAANGFPVSPGSYIELRAGPSAQPFYVGQSGKTPAIRTLELS